MNRYLIEMIMSKKDDNSRRDDIDYKYDRYDRYDRRDEEYDRYSNHRNLSRHDVRYDDDRDRRRDRRYEDDIDRHYEDMRYLKPYQIREWMEDVDAKWKKDQLKQYIEKENIDFESKDYTDEEFVMTVNMLYSDYKDVLGSEPSIYVKLAKKFLEDKDAVVKGGEKLSSYYYAIVYKGNEKY